MALSFPERATAAFQRLIQELFIHDQKCAESVEVVGVAFAREVVSEIRDVRAFANIGEIGLTFLVQRDPG